MKKLLILALDMIINETIEEQINFNYPKLFYGDIFKLCLYIWLCHPSIEGSRFYTNETLEFISEEIDPFFHRYNSTELLNCCKMNHLIPTNLTFILQDLKENVLDVNTKLILAQIVEDAFHIDTSLGYANLEETISLNKNNKVRKILEGILTEFKDKKKKIKINKRRTVSFSKFNTTGW